LSWGDRREDIVFDDGDRKRFVETARRSGYPSKLAGACLLPDAVYTYLRAKGIDVKKPIDRDYGMKQWYLKDPEGYGLSVASGLTALEPPRFVRRRS
jgi:hypothetical protein